MYMQHLSSSLKVTQAYDFFLFFFPLVYLPINFNHLLEASQRKLKSISFSPCLAKVSGWLRVSRRSAASFGYSLSFIHGSGERQQWILTNNAACLLTLHIIQPFERTTKVYERRLFRFSVFLVFFLSVTYGVEPCEPANIHLFLNYKNGSFIWFDLKLITDTFTLLQRNP